MKFLIASLMLLVSQLAFADDNKIDFKAENEELSVVVARYSKLTGQKFVIDPAVRGKMTILVNEPVTRDEAFNLLSSALATNQYAISPQGDTMVILSTRNAQRSFLPSGSERPSLKPERMYTWVYQAKNVSAETVLKAMRYSMSRDGESLPVEEKNQLIMTDWTSNLNRIADVIEKIDQKNDTATEKIVAEAKKAKQLQKVKKN